MSDISAVLYDQVGFLTFDRGETYFLQGKVNRLDQFVDIFEAQVNGSRGKVYTVRFSADLSANICTCPVGVDCKHFVAAVLQAQDLGRISDNDVSSWSEPEPEGLAKWLQQVKPKSSLLAASVEHGGYVRYVLTQKNHEWVLQLMHSKPLKNGDYSEFKKITLTTFQNLQYENMHPSDKAVLAAMHLPWRGNNITHFDLSRVNGTRVLLAAVQAGHCYVHDVDGKKITLNTGHDALDCKWTSKSPYQLSIKVNDKPLGADNLLLMDHYPALALDAEAAQIYMLPEHLTVDFLLQLQTLPLLSAVELYQFSDWLAEQNLQLPLPELPPMRVLDEELATHVKIHHDGERFYARVFHQMGDLSFEFGHYGDRDGPQLIELNGELVNWLRDQEAEEDHLDWLRFNVGLYDYGYRRMGEDFFRFVTESPEDWCLFNQINFADYHELGIYFELCTDEPLPNLIEVQSYQGEVLADEYGDWFELGLNVDIAGEKVNLVRLLQAALADYQDIDQLPEQLMFTYNNNLIQISSQAVQPILRILQQLGDDSGRIPRHHASVLNEIPFVDEWSGDSKIRQIADKLNNFNGIEQVTAPKGLQAELRDYQQQGVNWLNFLQEYGFAGILADDMGLGKTVQALAIMQHMLERGQLTQPIMVVCPTSLVGNWRSEAQKFAPDLKVLVLQGSERKQHFDQITDHHLVISTYPLMNRDFDVLSQYPYQWLVLDEAQVIKNPKAKMTQSIKQLQAQHKLCLTGTPMENHLGELWCLFDFLMPGYLGSHDSFKKLYQKPIEQGEQYAQEWLNKRVKPFMLRRTKEQVATELPAKTEIIQRLELSKEQRKLYESIRVTMESKVRKLIREKGLAKSQIEFLDALLKVRQACCHPQLVKLEEAKKMTSSAKLDFLMETLPEMLEEGRKVLVFSQFATMLGTIETELKKAGIKTTKLTGQTRKRQEAIEAFTSGSADVFLISLKAGGVGLNLTQADTVIHFDPWWNPAAENQATDRAYRIGQDKPVFVYKLVTQNTIEERVLALQERKSAMANAIYGDKQEQMQELSQMNSEQLLALFQ